MGIAELYGAKGNSGRFKAFVSPAVSFVIVAPWLLGNWILFDSPVQKSLAAHLARKEFNDSQGIYFNVGQRSFLEEIFAKTKSFLNHIGALQIITIVVILFLLWGWIEFRKRKGEGNDEKADSSDLKVITALSIPLVGGVFSFWIYYSAMDLGAPTHYLAAPTLSLFIIMGMWIAFVVQRAISSGYIIISSAVVILIIAVSMTVFATKGSQLLTRGPYHWQNKYYETAMEMNKTIGPDGRVAAFNAGIMGYFYKGTLINIDGVVNPEVLEHFADRTLESYLVQKQINYLVDHAFWLGIYNDIFGSPIQKNYDLIFQVPCKTFRNIICLKRKTIE